MRGAMVAALLAAASGSGSSSGGGAVSVYTGTAGACSGGATAPAATVVVDYATAFATAPNPTDVFKVYRDGVLVGSETALATSHTHTVTGYVEDGPFSRFTSSWVFRVDLCTSGGVVIETQSASPWAMVYGACV